MFLWISSKEKDISYVGPLFYVAFTKLEIDAWNSKQIIGQKVVPLGWSKRAQMRPNGKWFETALTMLPM